MKGIDKVPAVLLLEDGTAFHGLAAGKIGTTTGEICFNTGMTGYQEVFTDPSYFGQILVMTNVHIGNYGVKAEEAQSAGLKISGLAVRSFSEFYSRPVADHSLQDHLLEENLVAISNIDTRSLVRHIRSKGAMNAIISSDTTDLSILKEKLAAVPPMNGLELSSKVSTTQPYFIGSPDAPKRVAALDFGVKTSILNNLAERGCYLKVFPCKTAFEEMQSWNPDGYFLSNGPGDPAAMDYAVTTAKDIIASGAPLLGICLGHQIIARALGIETYKMHHGHRGLNHPVKNIDTGLCEITSQNHGFGVDPDSLKQSGKVRITHINLNDNTIEGMEIPGQPVFSVQYHPEASPGPHDSRYLFDRFKELLN